MNYFRLIGILCIVALLTGCLSPTWKKSLCSPEMKQVPFGPADGNQTEIDINENEDELPLFTEDIENSGLPTKTVRAGELISFPNLQATDPDGDPITYIFSNPLDEAGTWQTKEGDEGTYKVSITASDGESTTTQEQKTIHGIW